MLQPNDVLAVSPELLAKPVTRERRSSIRFLSPILACVAACIWLGNLTFAFVIVPKSEEIFTDFGVALPLLTTGYIDAVHWLDPSRSALNLLTFGMVLAAVIAAIWLLSASGHRGTRALSLIFAILFLITSVLNLGLMWLAMTIPVMDMVDHLNGGGA